MRRSALLLSLLLLSACAGSVHRLHELNPPANDFPSALASEYQAYADSESEQGRLLAAEHYARKGLKALKGETVEPDTLDTTVPAQHKQELADARMQLTKLLTDDVKRVAPQQLARTQLLFDCWQHQLSRDLNQEKAPCADEFHSTLAQLQQVADPLIYGKEFNRVLMFASHSAKLDEQSLSAIKDVAAQLSGVRHYTVEVDAYMGRKASQRKLSENRLSAVRRALVKAGVHERKIRIRKEGSAKAVVLSGDKAPMDTKKIIIKVKTKKAKES